MFTLKAKSLFSHDNLSYFAVGVCHELNLVHRVSLKVMNKRLGNERIILK